MENEIDSNGRVAINKKKTQYHLTLYENDVMELETIGITNLSEWVRNQILIYLNENLPKNKQDTAANMLLTEYLFSNGYAFNDYVEIGSGKLSIQALSLDLYQPAIFKNKEIKHELRKYKLNEIKDAKLRNLIIIGLNNIDVRMGV